jgi:hypothetical protein
MLHCQSQALPRKPTQAPDRACTCTHRPRAVARAARLDTATHLQAHHLNLSIPQLAQALLLPRVQHVTSSELASALELPARSLALPTSMRFSTSSARATPHRCPAPSRRWSDIAPRHPLLHRGWVPARCSPRWAAVEMWPVARRSALRAGGP